MMPAPGGPVVVKLGGRALEAEGSSGAGPGAAALRELAAELASLSGGSLLVHGGGAEVSAWCGRLGLAPRFEDGLRVTDPDTLEVAAAVLAGLANKRLVALLRAHGVDAIGLSALDGGIAECGPHPDAGRLGLVGAVRAMNAALPAALLAQGYTPVLASIGACGGQLLNLNADDFAAALAAALRAPALLLLSDTPGLRLDGALAPRLDAAGLDAALAHPEVTGGMRPKLLAARAALAGGVARVAIAQWQGPGTLHSLLDGSGTGTTIAGTIAAGAGPALTGTSPAASAPARATPAGPAVAGTRPAASAIMDDAGERSPRTTNRPAVPAEAPRG
ncbi:MAG: acetylglutamate kinase [Candidatus Eisenbacteria bacterium]|nr:acetylglutamate kinase [Candidatus Eisenbacteria bacterium]